MSESRPRDMAPEGTHSHGQTLRHAAPLADEGRAVSGGSRLGMACVSVFIAYHLLAVLVHNAPTHGLLRDVQARLEAAAYTASYLKAAGTATSWAVFVPEPPQQNVFVRALVVDAAGAELDQGL